MKCLICGLAFTLIALSTGDLFAGCGGGSCSRGSSKTVVSQRWSGKNYTARRRVVVRHRS